MSRMIRYLGMIACGLCMLMFIIGCGERRERKMTVHEEQHEGEVVEESPGEMIVE